MGFKSIQEKYEMPERYFIAFAGMTVAILLRWILDPFLGDNLPYLTAFGAVAFAVWFSGWQPAAVSTIVGFLILAYCFFPPRFTFSLSVTSVIGFLGSLFSCVIIIYLGESMRRAMQRAQDYSQKLEEAIAQRQEVEEEVRDQENQSRQLLESLPAAIYTTDAQGRITMFNQAAVEFSGRVPELGTDSWCVTWKLYRSDGTPLPHNQCPMAITLTQGKAVRGVEAIAERPDGSRVHFIPYPTPLFDKEGRLVGAVNMLVDITARKEAEQNLTSINQELKDLTLYLEQRVQERTNQLEEQSEQLRSLAVELTKAEESERKRLAQILHDHLQQLLVAAKIRLDVLQRKATDLDQNALKEMCSYLDQAFDSSRSLTAELRPPVLYEGGLIPALHFLIRKFQEQYKLKVTLSYTPNAEPHSTFLKAITYSSVREILFNTVKYAQISECFLKLERLPSGDIHVVVRDQGIGFDPEKIGRKGSEGFGLFSIRERMKALGGEFKIQSAPGKGTSFDIRLPDEKEIAHQEVHKIQEAVLNEKNNRENKGLLVLLADDHKIVRQSLAKLLFDQPFIEEVLEAHDGQEVLDLVQQRNPDVIIMDLNMPGMNGIEATRILHQTHPGIKIIGLSVQMEEETMQAMKKSGAIAYFHKSEDTDVLIKALKNLAKLEQVVPI